MYNISVSAETGFRSRDHVKTSKSPKAQKGNYLKNENSNDVRSPRCGMKYKLKDHLIMCLLGTSVVSANSAVKK